MSDEVKQPSESDQVLEMPWVLISNQINQLSDRFGDVNSRIDDIGTHLSQRIEEGNANLSRRIEEVNATLSRQIEQGNANLSRRIEEVNATLSKQIEQGNANLNHRMDGLDKRMDGLEVRLTNRVSTWVAIILPILAVILGFLLGHVHL